MGDWPEPPFDPILVLLAHSDCDGGIHTEYAEPLASRLEGILHKLDDENKALTNTFIGGLRLAAKNNEIVEFH